MQHISLSGHCGRNTRRGLSNRLKNNILCLAALLLLALMTSPGWAQTRATATDAQTLRAALEDASVTEIVVMNNIYLDNGHMTSNGIPFNSLYLVKGTKTIKSSGTTIKTIYRGSTTPPNPSSTDPYKNKYKSQSIVLTEGANLTIQNLILDGNNIPNFASMILVPEGYKWFTNTGAGQTLPANGGLTMTNCTIRNCLQEPTNDPGLETYASTYRTSKGLIQGASFNFVYTAVHNSGGAGVHFQPGGKTGAATNKIELTNCIFDNNVINYTNQVSEEVLIGGALAFSRANIVSGTIKGCTFTKNHAPNAGGAIAFQETLSNTSTFSFDSINTIGGSAIDKNTADINGGGILIEGGKVFICGQTTISYNEAGIYGGGIMLTGGELKFDKVSDYNDVRIEHNKTRGSRGSGGGGGGICVYGKNPGGNSPLPVTLSNHSEVNLSITNNTAKRDEIFGRGGGIHITGEIIPRTVQLPNGTTITYYESHWDKDEHNVDLNSNNRTIEISNNEAEAENETEDNGRGGGIYCAEKVDAMFTKCIIQGNKCTTKGRGGGINLRDSQATFTNCLIEKNFADGDGGGVYVFTTEGSTLFNKFEECTIKENGYESDSIRTQSGGGGHLRGGVQFDKCEIHDNKSYNKGGGLTMDYDNAELHNACRVYNNVCDGPYNVMVEHGNGGGIYYQRGEFHDTNYVYNNTATKNGGGVYVYAETNKVLQGLVIGSDSIYNKTADTTLGNKAVLGGGVYTVAKTPADNITLENCEIIYNQLKSSGGSVPIDKGGGLYMSETKDETTHDYAVELTGGTIIGHNHAKDGGGVYVPNIPNNNYTLTLKLINTTLCNNIATEYGGGIFNEEQIVTSENNNDTITFHGNRAGFNGGGIHNGRITDNENGQVLLTGTNPHIFTENRARSGGGIYNVGKSTCSLKNCQIGQSGKGNVAASVGGGIYVGSSATTTLLPGNITFEDNRATGNGGGICNFGTVIQTVTQTDTCKLVFDHNIANKDGGGVYHFGTPLTLTNAIFKKNTATENGGGIYHKGTCTLNNCKIGEPNDDSSTNSATNGGGIYMNGEELTIQGGWVSHNTATNDGGGIYLERENTLVYDSCLIQNNKANNNGGGIYVQGADEAAGLKPGKYSVSAFTLLDLTTNDTVGWINRQEGQEFNNLIVDGGLVSYVEIWGDDGNSYNCYFYYDEDDDLPSQIDIAQHPELMDFEIKLHLNDMEETHIWNDGAHMVIARFENVDANCDDYFELGGIVEYAYYILYNSNYYYYYVESAPIAPPTVPTAILTLNGSTVGGAGNGNEAGKDNEDGTGDGGGIYIEKYAKVIMTSDGSNGTYQEGITNRVTHNKAKKKAGGVYKDGTLQVEGHVVITENTAEHSTGGSGGGGKSADGSGQPEAGAIPAGTAAEKEE